MDHPNANLPTSSFDRIQGTYANPVYQPYNNFRIQNLGGNIIQGQLNKISVTEIMFPYNTPTVVAGQNDTFTLVIGFMNNDGSYTQSVDALGYRVPPGWYEGSELVTELNGLESFAQVGEANPVPISDYLLFGWDTIGNRITIEANTIWNAGTNYFTAIYFDGYFNNVIQVPSTVLQNPFNYPNLFWTMGFRSLFASTPPVPVQFTTEGEVELPINFTPQGSPIATASSNAVTNIASGSYYTGAYTNYIDIVSHSLCQAQYLRDSTTSQNTTRRDVIARVYVCNNISTATGTQEGTRPFIIYRIFPVPKVMKWTADRSIDSIELALYDMYGQPLPNTLNNNLQVIIDVPTAGTVARDMDGGEADYAITLHCHEPIDSVQNENVGYKY